MIRYKMGNLISCFENELPRRKEEQPDAVADEKAGE